MKIFNYGSRGRATIFVSPGADHPETSDWVKLTKDDSGNEYREPLQFTVRFKDGMADVPQALGMYLIAKKLAQKSPIITREPELVRV